MTATAMLGGGPTLADQQRRNFDRALEIIDRSGAAPFADNLTWPHGPLGRPRYFTNRALLAGLLYTALQHRTVKLTTVAAAVNMLPDDCLAHLDLVRNPRTGRAVNVSQVDHAWNRLAEACNPSPVRDGKRLPTTADGTDTEGDSPQPSVLRVVGDPKCLRSDHETTPSPIAVRAVSNRGAARDLDDDTAAQRRTDLHRLTDLIVAATIPDTIRYGAIAVDWTDHETTAKASTRRRLSADPDAHWGRRRRKNGITARPGSKRKTLSAVTPGAGGGATGTAAPSGPALDAEGFETDKDELFYGYNIHLATGVSNVDGPTLPELAVGFRLTAANDMAAVAPTAVDLLDTATAAGHPIDTLLIDLGYSMRSPTTLHAPVANRGVWLVHDLERAKQGRLGTYHDTVLINGVPHCPHTPPATDPAGNPVTLTLPGSRATGDDWAHYWEQRDRQDRYAFRPLGRRRPGAPQRYQCPAAAGKVRCPFSPTSQGLPLDRPDIGLLIPASQTPLRCCDTSLTAPADMGRAVRQEPVHGTRDWVRSYDRRSAVERYNAAIKDFGLDKMDVRVLGIAKRTLAITFAAAATNLRLLDATTLSTARDAA